MLEYPIQKSTIENMNSELSSEIRNKLTAPRTALDKLAKGEKVPKAFLDLALKDLHAALDLIQENETDRAS